MKIIYCEPQEAEFALYRKKLPDPIPVAEARLRHRTRQFYEAVLLEGGHPQHVVSVYDDHVLVDFLDLQLRCYLEYQFRECQPNRLFLTHATYREFVDETEDPISMKSFVFEENGYIYMTDEDLVAGTEVESKTNADPAGNWDDYPEFGNYAQICREDRG